ncbi:MAG: 50S ribosomal protein L17 [bacterium]
MSKFSKSKKLSRTYGHKKAMLKNMLASLVLHEQIKTTAAKAHTLKTSADKMISRAKKKDLNAIRYVYKSVNNKDARKKIFDVLVPRYEARIGGVAQVFSIGKRLSDNSEMALIKLMS